MVFSFVSFDLGLKVLSILRLDNGFLGEISDVSKVGSGDNLLFTFDCDTVGFNERMLEDSGEERAIGADGIVVEFADTICDMNGTFVGLVELNAFLLITSLFDHCCISGLTFISSFSDSLIR